MTESAPDHNSKEFIMVLYKKALTSYEQLYCSYRSMPLADNQELTLNLISNLIETITLLITLESDSMNPIRSSLLILETQLYQFRNKLQEPRTLIPSKGTTNNNNCETKHQRVIVKQEPKVKGLHEIAGHLEVKKILSAIVLLPIRQPQLYMGKKLCNSLLLFGPPGTGKTHLAHAIAAEATATFFNISSSDIVSEFVGGTEKALKGLFKAVKEEKNCTVLFLDEIDGLCQHRSSSETGYSRRMKTELLTQLSNFEDTPNKYLICATNCPWDLDSAILRRFQKRIYVPLPNKQERFELLRLLTQDSPLTDCELWEIILDETDGYSGSDLADLIRNAKNIPITELVDTCVWERIADNKYIRANNFQNSENLLHRKLNEMPQGSIQARPMELFDIINTLKTIKPTISPNQVMKYEEYVNKR